MNLAVVLEGSATAPESVRDFQISDRFQDFLKDFRFRSGYHAHAQIRSRPFKSAGFFEIFDFIRDSREDFRIPCKISGFHGFPSTSDSRKISRFREGFQRKRTRFQQVADPSVYTPLFFPGEMAGKPSYKSEPSSATPISWVLQR